MKIFCVKCDRDVKVRLTDGAEIYPHRPDLSSLPFWKCDTCGNFVGCHHKTENRTRPLGNIPTAQVRRMRWKIHSVIDPYWKRGYIKRGKLYREISVRLGKQFHTAEIQSEDEGNRVLAIVREIMQCN